MDTLLHAAGSLGASALFLLEGHRQGMAGSGEQAACRQADKQGRLTR
jgi:hypothetical protein